MWDSVDLSAPYYQREIRESGSSVNNDRSKGNYMNEQQVEDRLRELNKSAPRVTIKDIDAAIKSAVYWNPEGTSLTICVLTLQNGFHVTGESASASVENFDAELGQSLALQNARNKIWPLEGYLLRQHLYEETQKG